MSNVTGRRLRRPIPFVTISGWIRWRQFELLFRIEEAFEIQIPDEDLHKLVTVAMRTTYVEKKFSTGALDTRQDRKTDSFRFRKKIDGREKGNNSRWPVCQTSRRIRVAEIMRHLGGR